MSSEAEASRKKEKKKRKGKRVLKGEYEIEILCPNCVDVPLEGPMSESVRPNMGGWAHSKYRCGGMPGRFWEEHICVCRDGATPFRWRTARGPRCLNLSKG